MYKLIYHVVSFFFMFVFSPRAVIKLELKFNNSVFGRKQESLLLPIPLLLSLTIHFHVIENFKLSSAHKCNDVNRNENSPFYV